MRSCKCSVKYRMWSWWIISDHTSYRLLNLLQKYKMIWNIKISINVIMIARDVIIYKTFKTHQSVSKALAMGMQRSVCVWSGVEWSVCSILCCFSKATNNKKKKKNGEKYETIWQKRRQSQNKFTHTHTHKFVGGRHAKNKTKSNVTKEAPLNKD